MLATLQTRDFIGQREQVRFQNPRGRIAFAREDVAYRIQRQTGCAIRADRAQPCLSRVVVKTMAGRSSCARLQQAQRFVMQQRRARKPRVAGQSAYEIERRDARSVTARAVAGDRRLAADRRWENRRALLAKRMPGTAFARRSCRGGRRRRLGESIQQSLLARVSIAV
jgi:hypothetical protein